MAIIEYDHSPNISPEQRLKSLADSVRRAFEEIEGVEIGNGTSDGGKPSITLEDLGAYPKAGGTIEGDVSVAGNKVALFEEATQEGFVVGGGKPSKFTGNANIDGSIYLLNGSYVAGKTTDGRVLGQFTPLNAYNNCIIGYGGYEQSVGSTNIYGQDITFTSSAAGLANRSYGVNKVLWSGGMYMFDGQIATLSEAVSAQPHGIVLAFSDYTDGGANDYGWNYFFVPKYAVSKGRMVVPMHGNALLGRLGAKSLYIYDTSIIGHGDNTSTGTNSGVNYANNRFVLRYVIGV